MIHSIKPLTTLLLAACCSLAVASERPNIIFILLDDTGFSDLGAYGSEIATPHMDSLAAEGIRFNHFETRAICSSTRAALLTGRNNQSVGMMDLASDDKGGPAHSRGHVTPAAATIAQILKANGYRTTVTGKWHLTPPSEFFDDQAGAAASYANWPSGKGFDNFYGWLHGWTDQYNPAGRGRRMLEGDRPAVEQNPGGEHVSEEIVNRAIQYLDRGFKVDPEQPQFLYLSFGASHSPIQVDKKYSDKYRGVYDRGWQEIRRQRFERQKTLGIIPAHTQLSDWHADDPEWETLSDTEKTVFARFMEVYAGFLEHADAQVGRLVAYLKEAGQYDNTLIVLMSDNGAAPEAGAKGGFSRPYGDTMTVEQMLARLDDLGTERSQALYQRPWARVGSTPFPKYKTWPHAGGTRAPLIVTWPGKISDPGAVRTQFVDAIDLMPTVLDILDIEMPAVFGGVEQMALHGESALKTFDDSKARTRDTQFFVLRGQRGIYHDGWKAVALHENGTPFEQDRWALYHVAEDFAQAVDVADKYPEKLVQLQKLWHREAEKYGALPLVEFYLNYRAKGH